MTQQLELHRDYTVYLFKTEFAAIAFRSMAAALSGYDIHREGSAIFTYPEIYEQVIATAQSWAAYLQYPAELVRIAEVDQSFYKLNRAINS